MSQVTSVTNHETQGLLSPLIRNIRLRRIAAQIQPGETVLDIGCGAAYLAEFLSKECRYFGVDRIPIPGARAEIDAVQRGGILNADLLDPSGFERLQKWLPCQPDVLSAAAFLEHVADPRAVLQMYAALLKPEGRIIGTTPHPIGRRLHESLARLYLCSREGADEHEKFLDKGDLEQIAASLGRKLVVYEKFLGGLNQLFVM